MGRITVNIVGLITLLSASWALAQPPANPELAQLIEQLDSDEFAARQRAEQSLIARGRSVLPSIIAGINSASPEQAARCRHIFRRLHQQVLLDEFTRLATLNPAEIDIEYGLFLVSRIQTPLLERETINTTLDALAAEVQVELQTRIGARRPTPRDQLDAVCQVLFIKHGFTGNETNYAHPDNSALDKVLATKRGLPLTLSHVTIAVARRVGLRLQGVALPRRYMVWYQPPPGRAADEVILDPFDHGRRLTRDDLEDLLASLGSGFDQMNDLTAAPPHDTLARAIRNVRSHSDHIGLVDQAADCDAYLAALGVER